MATTGLFSRIGVRYELAQEVLGALISHHAEVVAREMDKASPDQRLVDSANTAKNCLREMRDGLDPSDSRSIEEVIKTFGPQARDLYAAK